MTFQALIALFTLFMVPVQGWKAPWFCHGDDCPQFTVVHTYEGFEERFYHASHWITVDIGITTHEKVKKAISKLFLYTKGENEEKKNVKLPWPLILSVEGDEDENHGSLSWPVPVGTHLPKPNDATIRETDMPAATVYVRSFGGVILETNMLENLKKLMESIKAAGKSFVPDKFVAAGYDPPLRLVNRHNEIWIFAD
ncbi:heme-binding protein 2-like isoform X2 [Clupea harengus]|uniref:Heme-binding protein 2-like isoform X2 n=1 Tax=Clupea harengus TaxID=7950 RepID=A0A6P8GHZ3_CLUHA|nr:heme-binding protein 2-like isoform X2 [Clupea harengus]